MTHALLGRGWIWGTLLQHETSQRFTVRRLSIIGEEGKGTLWKGRIREGACMSRCCHSATQQKVSWSESSLWFYNLTNVQQMLGEVSQGMHSQRALHMLA